MQAAQALAGRNAKRVRLPEGALVGRDREVHRLVGSLAAGAGVLLVGDAGVGKSRLASAVLDACERAGSLVYRNVAARGCQHVAFAGIADMLPPAASDLEVFRATEDWLRAEAGGRPVVVGVDDVHWLDDASGALLARLSANRTVTVLATARTDSAAAEPVASLRRTADLSRIDLAALAPDAVAALVEGVLGGPTDGLTRDAIWRLTQGNPLLVRDVVRAALDAKSLTAQTGIWTWRPAEPGALGRGDAARLTMDALARADWVALRYLAYGGPLPVEVFERLVSAPVAERLEERGLVRLEERGLVGLVHPIHGEAIRARTGPLRARRVLRDLAAELAGDQTGEHARDGTRLVVWRCDAGLPVPESELLAALDDALMDGHPTVALRLAERAGSAYGALYAGRALIVLGRWAEADAHLRMAYEGMSQPIQRARAAALSALNLLWGLRRPGAAEAVLAAARRTLPAAVRHELLVAVAAVAAFRRDIRAALGSVSAALDRPSGDPLLAAAAVPLRSYLLIVSGVPGLAAAEFTPPGTGVWPAVRAAVQGCHAYALAMSGRIDEAATAAAGYYADAVRHGSADGVGLLALVSGVCAAGRGRARDATRWYGEARAVTGRHSLLPIRAAILGRGFPSQVYQGLAGPGRLDGYVTGRQLRAQVEDLVRAGLLTPAIESAHLLSRIDPAAETAARLRRLASMTDSELFIWYADHADAIAAAATDPRADPGRLERLSMAWEERGYAPLALDAAARAETLCRPGDGRRAGRLGRRVARLRERCDGRWPAWLPRPVPAAALTRREREVCELAVAGLGNADIAARLVLSVRTVENHLQRAYDKLGVRQRGGLRRALAAEA
jgi:DNA-binding CsgD family transcriptional regulator